MSCGPLHGIPTSIKDLFDVAGLPTTKGSLIYKDRIAQGYEYCVKRLLDAGIVHLGKTNTPEFGFLPTTENKLFGATPQSVGYRAHAGRLQRRRRRGRCRGPRADRAGQRRRRFDPHPGVVLRHLRDQADVRPRPAQRRRLVDLHAPWPNVPHRFRLRTHARCHAGPRARRSVLGLRLSGVIPRRSRPRRDWPARRLVGGSRLRARRSGSAGDLRTRRATLRGPRLRRRRGAPRLRQPECRPHLHHARRRRRRRLARSADRRTDGGGW